MQARCPEHLFLGAPFVPDTSLVTTPYAFLGVPYGPPYCPDDLTVAAGAAQAVRDRAFAMGYHELSHHYDFDLQGPLFPDGEPTVSDCGDVVGDVRSPDEIWDATIALIRPLAAGGRVPLVVGGLDAIPPMVVAAFEGTESLNVLHVDAHVDFRQELGGVTRGYSSPIRRIRELSCVDQVVQVGLRSVGSGRPIDVAEARAAGNQLVTAWELRERGAAQMVEDLPTSNRWVVTIDCDGLDPTIAPGVGWPEPGGLTFPEIATLVRGLSRRSSIAAVVFTEFQPARDIQGTTAQTIARLLVNVLGLQRDPLSASLAARARAAAAASAPDLEMSPSRSAQKESS